MLAGYAALLLLVYRPLLLGRVVAWSDAYQLGFPDTDFLLKCLRRGEWPWWTPYQRLGQPFAGGLQTQAFYLPRLLSALAGGAVWAITWEQVFHAALACGGTYLAARGLGRSRLASFVAGAAWGAGPTLTQLADIPNMASTAAWAGPMLASAVAWDRHRSPRALAAFALTSAGGLMGGSPETWLWELLTCAAVTPRRKTPTLLGGKGLGVLWAFALAGVVVLPTVELTLHSVRTGFVPGQFDWAATPSALLSLFWLGSDIPRSAGEQELVRALFQGDLLFALVVLGGWARGKERRLLALAIFLALLSLGGACPVSAWLLKLPPFHLFRYPVKYAVGAGFCLCLVAARGLDRARALSLRYAPGGRALARACAVLVLLGLVALVLVQRVHVRAGAVAGVAWGAAALAAGLLAWGLPRGRGRPRWAHRALAGGMVLELCAVSLFFGMPEWLPGGPLTRPSRFARMFPALEEGRVSVAISGEERAARFPHQDLIPRSRELLVPLRNVEENVAIAEGYNPPEPLLYTLLEDRAPRALYDLAGVSLYLRAGPPPFPDLEPVSSALMPVSLYRSRTALPRAYISHHVRVLPNGEALTAMADPDQSFRDTTILAAGEPLAPVVCESPPPQWKDYGPNALTLTVEACAPGYLVVTDSYFPGWEARVDNLTVPIRRANLLVRAVRIPAGRHEVTMRYVPTGGALGSAASLAGLGLAGGVLGRRRRVASSNRGGGLV